MGDGPTRSSLCNGYRLLGKPNIDDTVKQIAEAGALKLMTTTGQAGAFKIRSSHRFFETVGNDRGKSARIASPRPRGQITSSKRPNSWLQS